MSNSSSSKSISRLGTTDTQINGGAGSLIGTQRSPRSRMEIDPLAIQRDLHMNRLEKNQPIYIRVSLNNNDQLVDIFNGRRDYVSREELDALMNRGNTMINKL